MKKKHEKELIIKKKNCLKHYDIFFLILFNYLDEKIPIESEKNENILTMINDNDNDSNGDNSDNYEFSNYNTILS